MSGKHHAAVIFDVDGPLLDLTAAEEAAFFFPFKAVHGITGLSNDWDAYRVRNDEDIVKEILEAHFGRPPTSTEYQKVHDIYVDHMRAGYADGSLKISFIPGVHALLSRLADTGGIALGIATANLHRAAEIRLMEAGLWPWLKDYPGTADGGGAKRDVLARVIAALGLPPERIVFLGDNLNDLDAATVNGVHFIGFHVDATRRARLKRAGARITCGDHEQTWHLIDHALGGV